MVKKGANAERELVQMFNGIGWAAIRVAGSGVSKFPSPDVVAGKGNKIVAIECKATKSNSKYIQDQQVKELLQFADVFGAEAYIAVRFNNLGWRFYKPAELSRTITGNYVVNKTEDARALLFNEISKT